MAHLTPPSSKQNTPVRRTDPAEAPVSPTSTSTLNPFRSSGSATLALASPPRQSGDVIDEEEGLDLQAGDAALGGAANEMDIDEEGESESESEDEIDVEDLEEVEGDEGLGPAPEQVQSIEGTKTEDIVEDAKVQMEAAPAGGALAPAALLAKVGGKKKKASRGNRSSKKQKKGKLPNNSRGMYESDIVARWNKDFGDVCSGGPLELPRRQ